WFWLCRFRVGALRRGRHAGVHRPASPHALLVGHQASRRRPVRHSRGMAGEQPDVEQHHEQLSRGVALPPYLDAQIPKARCRAGLRQASPPLEVSGRDEDISPGGPARDDEAMSMRRTLVAHLLAGNPTNGRVLTHLIALWLPERVVDGFHRMTTSR